MSNIAQIFPDHVRTPFVNVCPVSGFAAHCTRSISGSGRTAGKNCRVVVHRRFKFGFMRPNVRCCPPVPHSAIDSTDSKLLFGHLRVKKPQQAQYPN
jgi:hypothetical protein